MDLNFDSPADAAKTAKSLRVWADFMDANADKQIADQFYDGRGGMCALGAAGAALCGMKSDIWSPQFVIAEHFGISLDLQDEVGRTAARQSGTDITMKEPNASVIPFLNDCAGVTFPEFATACRTLASQIEEHFDTGPAIEAPALAEVTV